jgi:prolyl-tRNA editing enzyme YbaK/EbsC (Cys-tRNA(Pro) deacylase)
MARFLAFRFTSEGFAEQIGFPQEQVFKTLVARGDRHGVLIAVIPANAEVDFKALARQSNIPYLAAAAESST